MFYGLAEFYLYFILHVMLLSNVNNRFQSYTETNLRWELLDYYIVYEVTESVQLVYFLEECWHWGNWQNNFHFMTVQVREVA